MGLLEIKHGLLQVVETLDFLHNNAHLAHRAISPEVKIHHLLCLWLFVFVIELILGMTSHVSITFLSFKFSLGFC
jgi:hypothetical protein